MYEELTSAFVDGLIVGTGTVIAVMLPPMVIFFTAFNLIPGFPLDGGRVVRPVLTVSASTDQHRMYDIC